MRKCLIFLIFDLEKDIGKVKVKVGQIVSLYLTKEQRYSIARLQLNIDRKLHFGEAQLHSLSWVTLERSKLRSLRFGRLLTLTRPKLGHMLLLNINRIPYTFVIIMVSPTAMLNLILKVKFKVTHI